MTIGPVPNPMPDKNAGGAASVPTPKGAEQARNSGQGFSSNPNPTSPTPPPVSQGENVKGKSRGTV